MVHRFVGASYGGAFGMMPRRTCFDDNISVGIRTFYAGNAEYPITMGGHRFVGASYGDAFGMMPHRTCFD